MTETAEDPTTWKDHKICKHNLYRGVLLKIWSFTKRFIPRAYKIVLTVVSQMLSSKGEV